MRILHTSDWHIGRTFFGEQVGENLRTVLASLTEAVRAQNVDVVVVAGDIFDTAVPAAGAYDALTEALVALHETGAVVILTSGNHDSAARLRFQSRWARESGIHVIADPEAIFETVTLEDEFGPVTFYGVPYLEPALLRHLDGAPQTCAQAAVMQWAADRAREHLATHPARSVFIGHCFAAGVPASANAEDIERDLTAGGLDVVPLETFDGFDYVALGHIHGRAELRANIRYSGAPLHYSFSEAGAPRGAWLIDFDGAGFSSAEWLELPVPRPLTRLRGEIDELLGHESYAKYRDHWIAASLTDQARPLDAMARLRSRFPHAIHVEHTPLTRADKSAETYAEKLAAAVTDEQRVARFLEHTRNGVGPTAIEQEILAEVFEQITVEGATR
ncbi:exonuclease SbcCD subunit D [Gulosibacter molinativorax]|uniref:Nuclease SbcCD subunit D n=1 Tax=Gulosibacter molinativorax TaxID=256821 RepID=A0ABT7C596_9MICO|nr:exonuclease SbcCD subunit D [Gulosibacter molinativorax]MDJ1370373.1 exonuclease SbcCD subunit D [Gulosibacter molinativorax]QUY61286.1 Nuclease SbcCD subunit D [Gulosibacter molinativorax]